MKNQEQGEIRTLKVVHQSDRREELLGTIANTVFCVALDPR